MVFADALDINTIVRLLASPDAASAIHLSPLTKIIPFDRVLENCDKARDDHTNDVRHNRALYELRLQAKIIFKHPLRRGI